MSEWEVPILFMHLIADALSENTLIWIFSCFMKDFKPRSMAFSSSAFMCHCFSSRSQVPPLLTYPHMRPPIFEASVYMTLEIGGYCKIFDTNVMLSLYRFKSESASFDFQSCLFTFSVHIFYIYPMLYSKGDLTYLLGK